MSTWPTGNVPTTNVDESTDDPTIARINIKTAFDRVNAILESRGVPDGIPSLGTTGGIPRSQLGLVLSTTGGIVSGPITLPGNPTANLHAATKQYVDSLGVGVNSVGTNQLQDAAVTEAKIGAGAVTNSKLAAASVDTTKLFDASITTVKIADSAVTTNKLGTGVVTGAKIATATIDRTRIQNSAINYDKISLSAGSSSVSGASLSVTMNNYSFFPSLTVVNNSANGGGFGNGEGSIAAVGNSAVPIADPGNTLGRVRIWAGINPSGDSVTTIRWAYITSSDDPVMWLFISPEGKVIGAWSSDDALPGDIPGLGGAEGEAIKLTSRDLTGLAIPSRSLKAAEKLITEKKLKEEHLHYRALQHQLKQESIAPWLLEHAELHGSGVRLRGS